MRSTLSLVALTGTAAAWGGEAYGNSKQNATAHFTPTWSFTTPASIPSFTKGSFSKGRNATSTIVPSTSQHIIASEASSISSETLTRTIVAVPQSSPSRAAKQVQPNTLTETVLPIPVTTPDSEVADYLTTTQVVYATVDQTVTACSPAGTDACGVPAPSTYPGPPSIAPPPTCVLPETPLTNENQVGNSLWGTLCQPTFPQWLPDAEGKNYTSAPWGLKTPQTADATVAEDVPVTNVTRYFDFTITRSRISADGVLRDVMLVNNQFPGPAIEANWGDMIEITVHNNISFPLEGTSMHWHGFLQRGSNWADGVPSISECPIAPNHSKTYRFPAQLYGSSWYHAHYSAQYTAGIAGPIIIYGPTQAPYDVDLGPVMLTDWYHVPYFSIVSDAVGTDMSVIPPVSDNLLINGRGRYDCSAPSYGNNAELVASGITDNLVWTCVDDAELSKFTFQPGKTHRLRLMNMGADGVQKFQIDGHQLTVISYDYVPTTPHTTEVVTLGVGQRADVLVTANNYTSDMYWMRSSAPGGIVCGGSNTDEVLAAIYYEGADTTAVPTTLRSVNETSCFNAPLNITEPEYSITPTEDPFQFDIALTLVKNATGNFEWRMNDQTFRADFNAPLLYLAAEGNVSYPYDPQWQVVNFASNSSIVVNVTNDTPFTHPFHLHGHNFYVLNVGRNSSVWDGSIVQPSNPMRRDVQIIPAGGYAAIMFEADNPGVWPFHCHVAWHLSGGLAMNFITQPDLIPAIPEGERDRTCVDWDYYSSTNVVDQIDAGS